MSAIDHIETLYSEMPDLFQDRQLVPEWEDGYIILPIKDPEFTPEEYSDQDAKSNQLSDNSPLLEEEDIIDSIDIGGVELPLDDSGIITILGGAHSGAPLPIQEGYSIPPIDSLAFYLPYHYYHPVWWGIYIRVEGVVIISKEIRARDSSITFREANSAARLFLYYHEAFHHKTECFATRLEVTHRRPFFKTGFERYYQDTLLKSSCLEEALANAAALEAVGRKIKNIILKKAIFDALLDIIRSSPPGYAEGVRYRGAHFTAGRWEFSEKCQNYCLPHIPVKSKFVWATASHMFDPIANVKSRVNYILPATSPLAGRIPMGRTLMSPSKLKKKLKKLTGLRRLNERDGRHPIYETDDGKRIPIPEHPRDLGKGLLRDIIKQAGLNLSVRQFQNA